MGRAPLGFRIEIGQIFREALVGRPIQDGSTDTGALAPELAVAVNVGKEAA